MKMSDALVEEEGVAAGGAGLAWWCMWRKKCNIQE